MIVIRAKEVGVGQLAESNAYETPPFAWLESVNYGVGEAVILANAVAIADAANTAVNILTDGVANIEKISGADGTDNASAVSSLGAPGDFILRLEHKSRGSMASGNDWAAGISPNPTSGTSFSATWPSWFYASGSLYVFSGGGQVGAGRTPTGYAWIWRIGTNVYLGRGATFEDALASPDHIVADISGEMKFDSALWNVGAEFEALFIIPELPFSAATIFGRTDMTVTEREGRVFRLANKLVSGAFSADAISGALPSDFLIRVKPGRSDVTAILGVDTGPHTSASDVELKAGRAIYFQDTGAMGYYDGGVFSAGLASQVYSSTDRFWLERIGTTVKAYRGETDDFADAVLDHTFAALSGTVYFDSSIQTNKFSFYDVHVAFASTNRGSAEPLTVYRSLAGGNIANPPASSPDDWGREGAVYSDWSSAKFYAVGDRVSDAEGMTVYEALDGGVEGIATITIASPGVVTWVGHGLAEGDQVSFRTTGALPTGITADAIYYVKALTADTFKLATSAGGADINTSGTQSGAHLARGRPNINKQPSENPDLWVAIGPTNRWAMFDDVVGTATKSANYLDFTLELEGVADSLALLEMANAVSVQIIVTVDPEGEVYNETFDLTSTAGIGDWYTYFSEEIERETNLLLTDLPSFSNPTVQVIIIGSGTAELAVGLFAIGAHFNLGRTLHDGASVGIFDYSRKEVDDFGNVTIVERAYSKRGSFQTLIDKPRVDAVQAVLASLRATPAVYSASEDYDATLIFGFAKDFQIEIAYPNESLLSLEIEGLT